jgi:hypothetical protein
MIIDDAIIKQSLVWQSKYLRKECTLDEALVSVMHMGAPIPQHLLWAYENALKTYYKKGNIKDLAELLAHPMTTREKQAFNRLDKQRKTFNHVKHHEGEGCNLNNPNDAMCDKLSTNAFKKTANDLGESVGTVYRDYNRELKRIKP